MTDYISDLDTAEPSGQRQRKNFHTHLIALKQALYNTLKNWTGEVTATHTEVSQLKHTRQSPQNMRYVTATLSSTTYNATASPAISSYEAGQRFCLQASAASVKDQKVNINSVGAKDLIMPAGDFVPTGYIPANAMFEIMYDGTDFVLIKV